MSMTPPPTPREDDIDISVNVRPSGGPVPTYEYSINGVQDQMLHDQLSRAMKARWNELNIRSSAESVPLIEDEQDSFVSFAASVLAMRRGEHLTDEIVARTGEWAKYLDWDHGNNEEEQRMFTEYSGQITTRRDVIETLQDGTVRFTSYDYIDDNVQPRDSSELDSQEEVTVKEDEDEDDEVQDDEVQDDEVQDDEVQDDEVQKDEVQDDEVQEDEDQED